MPERKTLERARKDKAEGKAPSTQAGEFVREEMHHIREGKHGARSTEQAIAIGLSKARRAGVKLPPPERGAASEPTRERAERDLAAGREDHRPSPKRSRQRVQVLQREGAGAASKSELAEHAHEAAEHRSPAERSAAARKAARTKGPAERSAAAKKAARTRAQHKARGG